VPLEAGTAVDAAQGQHQFEVFCAVCHGADGTGQSVMSANMPGTTPPSLLSGSAAERSDTELAAIIANGMNRMPGYAWALSAPERDAIVAYMRRLQQSARPATGAAR
jgi:mono/diheme cytochrome c family protein